MKKMTMGVTGLYHIVIVALKSILIGFPFGWVIWILSNPGSTFHFLNNSLPAGQRAIVVALGIISSLLCALVFLVKEKQGRPFLPKWGTTLGVFGCLMALPWLVNRPLFHSSPILGHLLLIGAGIVLAKLLNRKLLIDIPEKFIFWLLVSAVLLASVHGSYYCILQHYRFHTFQFDLGNFEQIIWNSAHGDLFRSTNEMNHTHNTAHFSPGLLLLVPFYALVPRTETLLVIQALAVSGAAIPLYFLARRLLGSASSALLISIAYLLLPATQVPLFYDFHELDFVPLASLLLLTALEKEQRFATVVYSILLVSFKEELALVLSGIAAFYFVLGKQRSLNVALIVFAGLYFILIKGFWITHNAGGQIAFLDYYDHMKVPGVNGFGSLALTLFSNPFYVIQRLLTVDRVLFVLQLITPFAFVPGFLRRPAVLFFWPAVLCLMAGNWVMHTLSQQYTYYWTALLFAAFLYGMRDPESKVPLKKSAPLIVLILALLLDYQYGVFNGKGWAPWWRDQKIEFRYTPDDRARYRQVTSALKQIPADASVTASETLCPHLAGRKTIYTFRYYQEGADFLVLWNDELERSPLAKKLLSEKRYVPFYQDSLLQIFRRF